MTKAQKRKRNRRVRNKPEHDRLLRVRRATRPTSLKYRILLR